MNDRRCPTCCRDGLTLQDAKERATAGSLVIVVSIQKLLRTANHGTGVDLLDKQSKSLRRPRGSLEARLVN